MIYYKIPGWFDYQDIYDFAVDKFGDGSKFAEIGSWFGRSSCYMGERILQSGKNISHYSIDIWTHPGHKHMGHHETIAKRGGSMLSAFRSYMEEAGVSHLVTPIQGNSHQAHEHFENESLDFIFVDGDHSWEGVKNDIVLWWPKLNQGFAQKAYVRNGSWMMEKTLDGNFGRFGVAAMDREENQ
jgi:hypothetical protein